MTTPWTPLLELLVKEGYRLPENLTLVVGGHPITIEVPAELVGTPEE